MDEPTELQRIAIRIAARTKASLKDRTRQRALIRQRVAEGKSWDDIQAEAQVSRPTIMRTLKRTD